jgi:hypothetical protein
MIARLKGKPFSRIAGDRTICPIKGIKSSREFVYIAINAVPMNSVLRQVRANKATFTQGNFCGRACSNKISAGESNELFMKHLLHAGQRACGVQCT